MTTLQRLLVSTALLAVPSLSFAVPVTPGTNDSLQSGWAATVSQITGLKVLNSSGAGNPSGTIYWFFARNVALGAPGSLLTGSADFDDSTDLTGDRKRSAFSIAANTGNAGDAYGGGKVASLAASVTYDIYAQACPTATPSNNAACSSWVKLRTTSITTAVLPSNVFISPVLADVSNAGITINVNSGKVVGTDVLSGRVIIRDVDAGNVDGSEIIVNPFPTGSTLNFPISNSDYSFKPNNEYRYLGKLEYPYNQFTTQENKGPWVTAPVDPGTNGSITTFTHFTVTVPFKNAAGGVGNPTNTTYRVSIYNLDLGGAFQTSADVTTPSNNPAQAITAFVSNLLPDTNYRATVQAIGKLATDGSKWHDSNVITVGDFHTLPFTLNIVVSAINTNSANAHLTVNNGTGLDHFNLTPSPHASYGDTAWAGGTGVNAFVDFSMTGLTPNTNYSVTAKLCETPGSTQCSADLPVPAVTFATTPADPVPTAFSAPTARSLTASWTDNLNPNSSVYEFEYCLNSGFTTGCHSALLTKTANGTQTITVTDGVGGQVVTPETAYYAHVRTRSVNRPTTSDTSYVAFASNPQTTPNEKPTVSSISCAAPGATTTTCTAQGTDNGLPLSQLYCHWTVDNSASITAGNDQLANTSGVCPTVTVTFPGAGPTYTVTVVMTDHNGPGNPGALSSDPSVTTFGASQIPSRIDLSPQSPIVGRGQTVTFSATVYDQFTPPNVIPSAQVFWSVLGGTGGSLSSGHAASTIFTAGNTVGIYTLDATDGSSASTSTPVNVQANNVAVTPATPPNIGTGGTKQFTVAVTNPQGGTITPTITWSVSACNAANTINSTGLFSAGTADTTACVITATTQYGDTGTATITVDNSIPVITVQPSATLYVTSGTLSVSGTGFHGASKLTYTWSVVSPLGANVDFSSTNGTTTGNSVIVTFHQTGTYVFKATLTDTDPSSGATNSANTGSVILSPVLSRIIVSPDGITIKALDAQTFTASGKDQFGGDTSAGNVTWSNNGVGNISGAGVFSSPSLGSNITVRASNGGVFGTATVNVINFNISGAHAYPVPFKSTRDSVVHFVGLNSQAEIRIYSTAGREVFSIKTQDHFDWDTKNSSGDKVASGVYFYFIESPEGKKDGKLIIIQ